MAGASILSARACLRSGVGLLTVHVPIHNHDLLQTTVPEAIVQTDIHWDNRKRSLEMVKQMPIHRAMAVVQSYGL